MREGKGVGDVSKKDEDTIFTQIYLFPLFSKKAVKKSNRFSGPIFIGVGCGGKSEESNEKCKKTIFGIVVYSSCSFK